MRSLRPAAPAVGRSSPADQTTTVDDGVTCSTVESGDLAAALRACLRGAGCVAVALAVANCSAPQKNASGGIDPKYGVAASPRVVAEGQPVPKGGGRELVGKPYQVAGRVFTPRVDPNFTVVGTASWYGSAFHGRLTANGEVFDRFSVAAAHPTLPLPSYVRVTNIGNRKSMIVRVNDRGPFHGNRVLDVSQRVAEALEFRHLGTARVKVDYVGRASTRGSDDRILLSTLRSDGMLASLPGGGAAPVLVASAGTSRAPTQREGAAGVASAAAPVLPVSAANDSGRVQVASVPTQAVSEREPEPEIVAGRIVRGIPLPPERPFNLGTPPGVVTAAAAFPAGARGGSGLPARPLLATSLFFSDPMTPSSRFGEGNPMDGLKPQAFVPFVRLASN